MHQSILSKYFIYLRDLHAKASKISEIEITLQLLECTPWKMNIKSFTEYRHRKTNVKTSGWCINHEQMIKNKLSYLQAWVPRDQQPGILQ